MHSCKPGARPTTRRGTRIRKTKSKRAKQLESSESTASQCRQQQQQFPRLNQGLDLTSWSTSDTSQSTFRLAYPSMIQGLALQDYSRASSAALGTDATTPGGSNNQATQDHAGPSSIHPPPFPTPLVTPIVALVLPNYVYPSLASGMPSPQPVYHPETPGFAVQMHPFSQAAFSGQFSFAASIPFNFQNQFSPQHHFPSQAGYLTPSIYPPSVETAKALMEGQSRSTTPQSGGCGGPASPPIFQSSCSSPLNLLELELSVDRQDSTALPPGGQGNNMAKRETGASVAQPNEREMKQVTEVWHNY